MKRYFFYALLFPPAFMVLLLVQANPENLARFLLSGYVVAIIPALLIALTDEFFEYRHMGVRAGCCMLAAYLGAPLFVASPSLKSLQIGLFASVAALICFAAFNKRKKMLLLPPPEHFKLAEETLS